MNKLLFALILLYLAFWVTALRAEPATPFALMITVQHPWGMETSAVLDTGLTGEDCVTMMLDMYPLEGPNVELSCIFDHAYTTEPLHIGLTVVSVLTAGVKMTLP